MLENITLAQVIWLRKNKLTLSHLKYLEEILVGNIVPEDRYYTDMEKIGIIFKGEVTDFGKEIISELANVQDTVKVTKKRVAIVDEEFELWWKAYPATPSHGDYTDTRNLRVKKAECRKLLREILNEGEHSLQELIRILELEIRLRKEESVKRQKNELQYFPGTHTYLSERRYETWFEWEKQKKQRPKNYAI